MGERSPEIACVLYDSACAVERGKAMVCLVWSGFEKAISQDTSHPGAEAWVCAGKPLGKLTERTEAAGPQPKVVGCRPGLSLGQQKEVGPGRLEAAVSASSGQL